MQGGIFILGRRRLQVKFFLPKAQVEMKEKGKWVFWFEKILKSFQGLFRMKEFSEVASSWLQGRILSNIVKSELAWSNEIIQSMCLKISRLDFINSAQ